VRKIGFVPNQLHEKKGCRGIHMVHSAGVRGFVPVFLGLLMVAPLSLVQAQSPNAASNAEGAAGGRRIIEPGQPPVVIHATVGAEISARASHARPGGGGSKNLSYHGGTGGIGVETAPKIYLVQWGSQWNNNDPSGEIGILASFYGGAGGSAWLNSVTQYCQGVASGTVTCGSSGTSAGNQKGMLAGMWFDNAASAPSRPSQAQLAAEAVKAAAHFGNTTASRNASVQYVIATASGNNASGFGTQYCAWHSSTSSSAGNIAYTNLPYMTDAGASCGANFNGLGAEAGITIVGGHEMAETITDQFPSSGWLDANGEENGDKCAWISSGQGASADVTTSTGSFPVQSLWSNAFNSGAGGCVLSF
jgi:serine protease